MIVPLEVHKAEVVAATTEGDEILAMLDALPCETSDDEALIASILIDVKGRAKALDDRRKEITGPLNAAKKSVDDLFRPAIQRFEKIETALKGKIADLAIRRRELADAALREVAKGNHEALAIAAEAREAAKPDGVSVRYVWKTLLVDLSKVPWQFLDLDMDKVRNYTDQYSGSNAIPPIPGLEFVREAQVRAKRGT